MSEKSNQQSSDFTKGFQNYEESQQDRYIFQPSNKLQQTQLRKIDLNRTSNINNQQGQSNNNNSNRSQSRNTSPSQPDNGRFISFKKNLTYEQSKQQRHTLTQSSKQNFDEDNASSNLSHNNNYTSRSGNSLSNSSRFTPIKKQQQYQQSMSNQNSKQSVKVIKVQLEKEKKQRDNSLSKLNSVDQQKMSKSTQPQLSQHQSNYEDHFDFSTLKNNHKKGNKLFQERQSLNENQNSQASSGMHSPNLTAIYHNQSINKHDISFDSYLDKKIQMKLEFSKIDQKFDKKENETLPQSHSHCKKLSDLQESESTAYDKGNNNSSNQINNYSIQDKYTTSTTNSNTIKKNNDKQKQSNQTVDITKFSEFEMLEQSIIREELEHKEKLLQSKGISSKKQSKQSSGFTNSNYNNYFTNATPTSDSLKQLNGGDSDICAKEVRSSAFGGDVDNLSITSSINRNIEPSKQETNKNSILNIMKGGISKQSSQSNTSSNQQKTQSGQSDLFISQQSSIQNLQSNNINKINNMSKSKNSSNNYTPAKQKNLSNEIAQKFTNDFQVDYVYEQQYQQQNKMNTSKRNNTQISSIGKLPYRNISPTLQISKSQQQLNYVSESSKRLYLESQEIGMNNKSKENIALFKQVLETRNKIMRNSGLASTKVASPSTRYQETKKIHTVNQNIINSNMERGSLTSRKKESGNNNQSGDLNNNKQTVSDNNSITTAATFTTNTTTNNKAQISTPVTKQNAKTPSNQNSVNNQKGKLSDPNKSQNPNLIQINNNSAINKNNGNYFLGNYQSLNSMQTTVSKTEIGTSQNQIDNSNFDNNGQYLLQSPSQKIFLDYQNKQLQPLSPTFQKNLKNTQKNMNKSQQAYNNPLEYSNYNQTESNEFSNSMPKNKRDSDIRKSDLVSNQSNVVNYNFINEKSSIINKISGTYKMGDKPNLEKSFNLITPSKQTVTRQIQLGNNQIDNYSKTGEKQLDRDRSRDASLERKQNNFSILRSKSQHRPLQPNIQQISTIPSTQIQFGDMSPVGDFSNKTSSENTQTLLKDQITSLSKLDIKDSANLSKIPTIQTNLTVPSKTNNKQRNSLNNISSASITKQSKANNIEIREVQIQPSQHSTFNFKPSYFTPLNYEDLSDYIEQSKRNASPTLIPLKK